TSRTPSAGRRSAGRGEEAAAERPGSRSALGRLGKQDQRVGGPPTLPRDQAERPTRALVGARAAGDRRPEDGGVAADRAPGGADGAVTKPVGARADFLVKLRDAGPRHHAVRVEAPQSIALW